MNARHITPAQPIDVRGANVIVLAMAAFVFAMGVLAGVVLTVALR